MKQSKKIVLLVEDEAFLLKTLTRHLQSLDYDIRTAMNGQEALDLLTKVRPDLILTDLVMPKMDGFDFLAELRQHPEYQHIPVVVITNLASDSDEQRCRDMGIEAYFTKADTPLTEIEGIIKKYLA